MLLMLTPPTMGRSPPTELGVMKPILLEQKQRGRQLRATKKVGFKSFCDFVTASFVM